MGNGWNTLAAAPRRNRDGWRGFSKAKSSTPEYQELKFALHRKLLDRINLEALSSLAGERARLKIRAAPWPGWSSEEKTPLSLLGKRAGRRGGAGRSLRTGPAGAAAAGSHHLRHPGDHAAAGLRGAGRQAVPHAGASSRTTRTCCASSKRSCRRVGRRVDESSPLVDARLPDGSRVNAAIPPVAVDGPLLSIRRFGRHACMHGEDLVTRPDADRGHAGRCCESACRRG